MNTGKQSFMMGLIKSSILLVQMRMELRLPRMILLKVMKILRNLRSYVAKISSANLWNGWDQALQTNVHILKLMNRIPMWYPKAQELETLYVTLSQYLITELQV